MLASDTDQAVVLLHQSFDVGDLVDVREQVHLTCVAAGLSGSRAEGFAASVNEAMTNAIVHGGPRRDVTVTMPGHGRAGRCVRRRHRRAVRGAEQATPTRAHGRPGPVDRLAAVRSRDDQHPAAGTCTILETDFPNRDGPHPAVSHTPTAAPTSPK